MTSATLALVVAGCSVLASVLAVLSLAFRVGKLVGTVAGFMSASTADRTKLHEEIGEMNKQLDTHLAFHLGRRP